MSAIDITHIKLKEKLSKSEYEFLVDFANEFSLTFQLVTRCAIASDGVKRVIKELSPFLVSSQVSSSWPGTRLLFDTANVYQFNVGKIQSSLLKTM